MQDKGTPRLFRVKAVAEMFDVSPSTIYRAIESGQLEALKIGSGKGSLRIPDYAIEAFREACAEAAHRASAVGGESAESADLGRSSDGGEFGEVA